MENIPKRRGRPPGPSGNPPKFSERDLEIKRLITDPDYPKNYTEIGLMYGVSRERVRQIADRFGVKGIASFDASRERKAEWLLAKLAAKEAKRAARAARLAEAARLFREEGMSLSLAFAAVGFKRGQVGVAVREAGLVANGGRWRAEQLRPQIVAMAKAGKYMGQITEALSVGETSVRTACAIAGIPCPLTERIAEHHYSPEKKAAVVAYMRAHPDAHNTMVARKFHVRYATLVNWRHEAGVRRRRGSFPTYSSGGWKSERDVKFEADNKDSDGD